MVEPSSRQKCKYRWIDCYAHPYIEMCIRERYIAALREYKQSEHALVFASFANGAPVATSEKDCLRSLPDSLDVVSLTNADNFSEYDREDLTVLKEKGTRAVYFVDYASRSAEFTDLTALGAYLDKVVARTREPVSYTHLVPDIRRMIFSKRAMSRPTP